VVLAALGLLSGCGGPQTAEVSGTITLKGKAPNLDGLQINFLGKDGRAVSALVNPDGTFKATSVPVGEEQVGLSYTPPEMVQAIERLGKSRKSPEELAKGPGAGMKIDPDSLKPGIKELGPGAFKNPIPERYLDPRTSQKTITVEAGRDNVLTWDIRPYRP
jgi:hypothetical protein